MDLQRNPAHRHHLRKLIGVDVHSHSSRAGAAAVATALLLCTSLAAANAASSAKAESGAAVVISGSWGAVATTKTAAPYGSGPLQLNFRPLDTRPQYFSVANTGTLPLIAQTLRAATDSSSAAIEACSTTWDEITGSCLSGTITTVVSTATGSGSAVFPAPLPDRGSLIRLRALLVGSNLLGTTVTIRVDVTRAQARAATISGA